MDQNGEIEIIIEGKVNGNKLTPDNFDIRDIILLFENVENILYPGSKKDRPIISYEISNCCIKNTFKTSIEAITKATAVASLILSTSSIDNIDQNIAKAIENMQLQANSKNYNYIIKNNTFDQEILRITPFTNYIRKQNIWVNSEMYLYGILTDAGGKTSPNIHIDTKEFGTLKILAKKEFLEEIKENVLYKQYGIRAMGKQNIETGDIDKTSLELIDLIEYSPKYDENYLSELINRASNKFINSDNDNWLDELRGDIVL